MRRILIIAAAAATGFLLIGLAGLLVLFHTPPGRAFLVSLIEKEAGKAIGGKAEIGALGGVLPN
ncbi:MAG: hypothetical protein AB7P23_08760, partial [Amphiplicatus sp.]